MSGPSDNPSGTSLAARLLSRLEPAQEIRTMGGRDLISLDGASEIIGLLEGELDIFLVDEDGGGRRRFLLSVGEGAVAPLLALARTDVFNDAGWKLAGVPSNGARIARLSLPRVRTLEDGDAADRELLVEVIDSSLTNLTHSLATKEAVLRAGKNFSGTEPFSASAGDRLHGTENVRWVRLPARGLLPRGLAREEGGEGAFPVSDQSRVPIVPGQHWEVLRDFETTVETTGMLLAEGAWAASYGDFLTYLLELHLARIARQDLDDSSLAAQRTEKFQGIFQQAKSTLSSALSSKRKSSAGPGDETLLEALRLVASAEGCALTARPDEIEARLSAADPVAAVLQLSGVAPRPVQLEGPWWKQDHGALLGFHGSKREPRALLPRFGRRSYWSVNPESGSREKLTQHHAEEFAPDAIALLRPLGRDMKSPFALLRFGSRGASGDLVMIFLMMMLVALSNMVTPIVTGEVMGPITADARTNDLIALLGLMFVAGGAGVAFGLVEAIASLRLEGRMGNSIQTAIWLRLLELPMNFFERYAIGDLVNRADGVDALRSLLSSSLTRTLLHAISGLTSLTLLVYYNWKITVAVALLAVIYLAATIPAGFIFLSLKKKIQGLAGRTEGLIFQLLTNQTKIRMAGAEKVAFSRWSELYEEMQHCFYRDRLVNLVLNLIKGTLHTLALAMILLIVGIESGAFRAFFGVPSTLAEITRNPMIQIMPTASFVAFNVAMGQFMGSLFALGETMMTLLTAVPLYQRVRPILDAVPESSDSQSVVLPRIRGRIAFDRVTYRYRESDPNILEDFSFHVEPGEMVALVGESGAGKSTVFRLLLAFDSPQDGSILLDDTPLVQLDPKPLRSQFGVVMQDAQLIAGSILENIAGGTNLTESEALDAARLAGLDTDLEQMPMGLQTIVMEGAGTISGGQRQRILIARALARKPSLILFDEATSALDNQSQAQVTEALAELAVSRVVIAHRLSTIVAADRICFVGEGRVLEQGTYQELMKLDGHFAELARRQLA